MGGISGTMGFLFANVGALAIHAVTRTYTDYEDEALIIAAIGVFLLYLGVLMLKSAQHQCFQDRMNGDFSIFESDEADRKAHQP